MIQLDRAIVLGTISLVMLVGCSQGEPTSSSASPSASSPAASSAPESAQSKSSQPAADGFGALTTVVTQTRTAVQAGDYAKAKADFDQFEDAWSKVENGVKAKNSKAYDTIEAKADGIEDALKATKPDQPKVLNDLQTLEQTIASVAK